MSTLLTATGAQAATVVFDFSLAPHRNNIGNTETYTVDGLSLYASGFAWGSTADHPLTADLYGKHSGGDENGLGLNNDPTGDHEIHYHSGFVQLDMSGLFGHVLAGSTKFGTNSTSGGEAWTVYGTNTAKSLAGAVALVTGSNETVNRVLPNWGTYRYYDFVETGVGGGRNFLITKITTTSAPEPAAWALLLLGFGGLGANLRRRRLAAA